MTINPLQIAVSTRSLFNFEKENSVYINDGIDKFIKYVRKTENKPLEPGAAFPLISTLLQLNSLIPDGKPIVEVTMASSVHSEAALKILNSAKYYNLDIKRASFTGGASIVDYLKAMNIDLFLSKSNQDVQEAINKGIAAAVTYEPPHGVIESKLPIRIAFDGDAVIFSDESEKIYQQYGINAFMEHEEQKAKEPMLDGPFANFLRTIKIIQDYSKNVGVKPFRIALITARGEKAKERVMYTLRAWNIDFDEVHFLSGFEKKKILEVFKPHIFFDDQDVHLSKASSVVPSARVPYIIESTIEK